MFPVINEACRVVEEVRPLWLLSAILACSVMFLRSTCHMCSCSIHRQRGCFMPQLYASHLCITCGLRVHSQQPTSPRCCAVRALWTSPATATSPRCWAWASPPGGAGRSSTATPWAPRSCSPSCRSAHPAYISCSCQHDCSMCTARSYHSGDRKWGRVMLGRWAVKCTRCPGLKLLHAHPAAGSAET